MSKKVKFIGINSEDEFDYFINWCILNTDFRWVDGARLNAYDFKSFIKGGAMHPPPYAFIIDGNNIMFNSYSNILQMNSW